MNYGEAKEKLEKYEFQYLIIGFKHDGMRRIPANYEMDCVPVNSGTIYNEMQRFESFKVFEIPVSEIRSEAEFKIKMKVFFDTKKEKEEKELLQKLKNKYE